MKNPNKERGLIKKRSPTSQLNELVLKSKVHSTNSIGEVVRIEFFNGNLKKQYIGLLINSLIKKTEKYIYLVIVDGNIGISKIKVAPEEFDEQKMRITRIRSLVDPCQTDQLIPVDKEGKFTLSPEKIRKIKKIDIDSLKKLFFLK